MSYIYIVNEEYDRVMECLEDRITISPSDEFASYDDFEDEYGHNEIDEAQQKLREKLNKQFIHDNTDLVAFQCIERVRICTKDEYRKRFGEEWNPDYGC